MDLLSPALCAFERGDIEVSKRMMNKKQNKLRFISSTRLIEQLRWEPVVFRFTLN